VEFIVSTVVVYSVVGLVSVVCWRLVEYTTAVCVTVLVRVVWAEVIVTDE
jgi:hypothetical protein